MDGNARVPVGLDGLRHARRWQSSDRCREAPPSPLGKIDWLSAKVSSLVRNVASFITARSSMGCSGKRRASLAKSIGSSRRNHKAR